MIAYSTERIFHTHSCVHFEHSARTSMTLFIFGRNVYLTGNHRKECLSYWKPSDNWKPSEGMFILLETIKQYPMIHQNHHLAGINFVCAFHKQTLPGLKQIRYIMILVKCENTVYSLLF
jgi:hypothetical protein